ncbi:zinc finger protein 431-like isoform X2 [Melitaea cinxia]|uniref:zinc finger protein 431-like isoform X2 n=1 Tax=Melitaea cinxia TaxID=113334 RepID=UPI001E2713BE|nr:zinc finger protein 431-like isoform X2 [Melitaea cinxia]
MDENTLCRICLENGANLPIFEKNDDDCNDIQYKFTLCLKEKIEDIEGYPRYICQKCNDILDATCNFINKYKDTCKILENGLDNLKHDSEDFDSFNCNEQSEEEIELDNIKYEYIHDDDPPSDENEDLKPIKLKFKMKKENASKIPKRTRHHALKVNRKQFTNKIASSILEGEFLWNGDSCYNSEKTIQIKEKANVLLSPKPDNRKRIKIKIPKKKEPKSKEKKLCDLCGEVFKTADSLTVHKKNTHFRKSVKCEHCSRTFVSDYYLSRHVKRKHSEDKKFICPICGRGFAFKGELSSHNKKVHDKHLKPKKQFKCSFCNKTYMCNKSVTVHERSAHTGLRPAACTQCDSSFYHEDYLKEHMRLHTGETPFKCPICSRGYAQRCNMKSHLRIHRRSEIDAATLGKLKPNYLRLLKP